MTLFLVHQLKASVCIALLTLLYYGLFRKETFYRFNRFYLVGSLVISYVLPAIHLEVNKAKSAVFIPDLLYPSAAEIRQYRADAQRQAHVVCPHPSDLRNLRADDGGAGSARLRLSPEP
jgi:hypothetical protein